MRLRRERVVDVAIALLDAEGLDALTMRKLAARLGVQAGALYWHFAGKQALLDAMADRFLEDFAADLPAGPWDEQLAAAGWRLRQVLLSHRDGARVMAGTYVAEPNTVLAGNMVIEILQAAGLPPDQAGWAAFAALHYVLGHTIEEQAQIELHRAWRLGAEADRGRDREQARRHGLYRRSRRAVRLRPPALPRRHPPATGAASLRRPGSRQTHRKPARRAERTVPGPAPRQREVSSPVAAAAGRHRPLEGGPARTR